MKTTEIILAVLLVYLVMMTFMKQSAPVVEEPTDTVVQPVVVYGGNRWGGGWGRRGPFYRHGGRGWRHGGGHRRGLVAV